VEVEVEEAVAHRCGYGRVVQVYGVVDDDDDVKVVLAVDGEVVWPIAQRNPVASDPHG
jgi:hypothetical protein